jgi:hypothetical protein
MNEHLQKLARECASKLAKPDKKQLRFNDIVKTAQDFYNDPEQGVKELVQACCKNYEPLYVKGNPMHECLDKDYSWMRE